MGRVSVSPIQPLDFLLKLNAEEDRLDRQLQSTELGRLMAEAYPMPTIFLGYVVTRPHAKKPNPYRYLVEDGQMYDIDEEDKDRW